MFTSALPTQLPSQALKSSPAKSLVLGKRFLPDQILVFGFVGIGYERVLIKWKFGGNFGKD